MTFDQTAGAISRRSLLAGAALLPLLGPASADAQETSETRFLLTNPTIDSVSILQGDIFQLIPCAASPWDAVVTNDGLAYVSCAQGLCIVDLANLAMIEVIPFRTTIDSIGYGEYRAGGMGIALSPDESTIAVGLNLPGGSGVCELFDVTTRSFRAIAPIGIRPFDVVASADGASFFTVDHDSFTLTAIDSITAASVTIDAAPLGYGEFDKPHYSAVRADGTFLLPYVGEILWMLNPESGEASSLPMKANTHQHGITLSTDETRAYIVGTGPAGPAPGPPGLTVLDLETGGERVIELEFPHEQVALSSDGGTAILTGGYTFADGGWDGITRIDVESGEAASMPMDGRPLAIIRID